MSGTLSKFRAKTLLFSALFFLTQAVYAQNSRGIILGKVVDGATNEAIYLAFVKLEATNQGISTDSLGQFAFTEVAPGFQNITVSALGYKTQIYRDILVNNAGPVSVTVVLEPEAFQIDGATIVADPYTRTTESPVSIQTISIAEIERNPGGNRDISSVLKSFPGVASTPAFRNDIIIRGGSPGENKFYLDEIEVPVINHFQTQGASGGPVGIINVNLIREVNFLSGSFPAARGNTLSSVLEFKQVDGNPDKWKFRIALGSSDAGIKADGPIGKKSSLIVSVRASYLQLLFAALKLPFLPTYFDYQLKYKVKFNEKNELSIVSLGALDLFKLNYNANETKEQRYLLNILPINNQWNYTVGAVYKNYGKTLTNTVVLSRNMLNNRAYKYENNEETDPSKRILDYTSQESENKFRYEGLVRKEGYKITFGLGVEYARYTNSTYSRFNTPAGIDTIDFTSKLHLVSGFIFAQASKGFWENKFNVSVGVRFDNNNYNSGMANPLNQFSPRVSFSLNLIKRWFWNVSAGRYYQRPAYTILGYGDESGALLNQQNRLTYIGCDHLVTGIEYNPTVNTKISVEGFFKFYRDYPFSLVDTISIANQGADFGVVGNVPAESRGEGRAYGFEVLAQQKLYKGFYGILAYTFVRSEFKDKNGNYIPSAWDSRHIFSLTAGYKLPKNWEIGLRFRLVDGQPFTPYDTLTSSLKGVWDITGQGIPNTALLNTQRIRVFHQLDIRIDKVWYFKKWSFNLYIDVQNVYNFKAEGRPNLTVVTDDQGNKLTDVNDPSRYQIEFLRNQSGTVIPTLGIIVDF